MRRRYFVYLIVSMLTLLLSGCGYNQMQANEEAVKAAWGDVESPVIRPERFRARRIRPLQTAASRRRLTARLI